MSVKFYDVNNCEIGKEPMLVSYNDLDCERVAASIEGENSGYVCQYCQQYVEFYRLGIDGGVRYNCGCV